MKQNIYDNPDFFRKYRELRDNDKGLNGLIEQPCIYELLPPLKGKNVLDLGCGFGHFVKFLCEKGASKVVGVDISDRMIQEAKRRVSDENVSFEKCAIEDFSFDEAKFDLVTSSMMFHYVENIDEIFQKVCFTLQKKGLFIFSVEHPVCTSLLKGWVLDNTGAKLHWPVDRYSDEGKRNSVWFVKDVIKYHRKVSTILNSLLTAGFLIERVEEPEPEGNELSARPDLKEHLRRPPVLIIKAKK